MTKRNSLSSTMTMLSKLASAIIMLEGYAESNKDMVPGVESDMLYGANSLRECMYLLASKESCDDYLDVIRREVRAQEKELEAQAKRGH